MVLGLNDGVAQGSARSVDGVSIHDALSACGEYLQRFGGHAMAAGLTLATEKVDALRDALVAEVNTLLDESELVRPTRIDAEVAFQECTLDTFDSLSKLAPFGRGNPTPRLLLRGAVLDRPSQRMGTSGQHLSLSVAHRGRTIRAVAFGMGEHASNLPGGASVDLVFEPKVNAWKGVRRPELHIHDFKILSAVTA